MRAFIGLQVTQVRESPRAHCPAFPRQRSFGCRDRHMLDFSIPGTRLAFETVSSLPASSYLLLSGHYQTSALGQRSSDSKPLSQSSPTVCRSCEKPVLAMTQARCLKTRHRQDSSYHRASHRLHLMSLHSTRRRRHCEGLLWS